MNVTPLGGVKAIASSDASLRCSSKRTVLMMSTLMMTSTPQDQSPVYSRLSPFCCTVRQVVWSIAKHKTFTVRRVLLSRAGQTWRTKAAWLGKTACLRHAVRLRAIMTSRSADSTLPCCKVCGGELIQHRFKACHVMQASSRAVHRLSSDLPGARRHEVHFQCRQA